jgi:hypothetical protein
MAGLGDGLNDVSMLREVDLPVIVRSDLNGATGRMLRKVPTAQVTSACGPAGWAEAVTSLLNSWREPPPGGRDQPGRACQSRIRRAREQLSGIGKADLVVGFEPERGAIGHCRLRRPGSRCSGRAGTARTAFHGRTAAVVASAALDAAVVFVPIRADSPLHRALYGVPGRSAFGRSFAAEFLDARACAVVDADLRSITPEWIHLLIAPSSSRAPTS